MDTKLFFHVYYCILTIGCILSINIQGSNTIINVVRFFLVFTFFIESSSTVLAYIYQNNILINNLWLITAPSLFIYILCSKIRFIGLTSKYLLIIGYLSFSIINIFFIQGFHTFNTYSSHLATFIILFLIFFNLNVLFNKPGNDLAFDPFIYLLMALFFLFVGGFLVNVAINYIITIDMAKASELLIIRNFVNVISYTLFVVALMVDQYRVKKRLAESVIK